MKLISLYIDSFGKLSNYSYDFSSSLNTIYEENGWGKTTLTVFIKAMIYGLDRVERTKYTPWTNLTSFGGSLVLEASDRMYRIERTFSPKRATLDILKVYDLKSGKEINVDSNLGEAFLNLNANSFERSVFIPQKDLDDGFGSDIEAKLANLIGGTNDSQSFDDAIGILTTKLHEIKLNSKKGILIDKKKELFDLDTELIESENKLNNSKEITRKIELIDAELDFLSQRKKALNAQIYDFSKNQEKRAKFNVISKYDDDIKNAQKALDLNNEVFNGNIVTQEEIDSIRNKNKEVTSLKTAYDVINKSFSYPEKYESLNKTYNEETIPSDEKMKSISEKIDKHTSIKGIIEAHRVVPKKDKPILGIVSAVIGSLLLVIGAALLVLCLLGNVLSTKLLWIPITLIGVSAFAFMASLAGFIMTSNKNTAKLVGGSVKAYDFELIRLEEELREFFSKYHLYTSDFKNNFYIVRSNVDKYLESKDEFYKNRTGTSNIKGKILRLDNEIAHFLSKFKSSPNLTIEERIGELNTHLRNQRALQLQLSEKIKIKEEYILVNELTTIESYEFDIDYLDKEAVSVDNKIEALNQERLEYVSFVSDVEKEITNYDMMNVRKSKLESEIKMLEVEYNIAEKSIEFLSRAQNTLLEKYVKPMSDSVNKYIKIMFGDEDEYSIDVNFKFKFVTDSGLKDIASYSRGYQSVISLCMRLALVDCLYPNEKPFIILDDPFVNFDDNKLDLCKKLINGISSQYQIVYFTCHDSRKM